MDFEILNNSGSSSPKPSWQSILGWSSLTLVILITCAIRIRLLSVPLERDEGEYAYAGQLILQGIPPYTEVYNMKMPGIYAVYAAILAIFGQTQTGIHLGLLVFNIAAIIALYFLFERLFGQFIAVAAASIYAVLSLGVAVQGVFANAEHFLLVPALLGLFFLILFSDKTKISYLIISGFLLGLSFIVKQHAAAFVLFGACYLLYDQICQKTASARVIANTAIFAVSAAAPFILTCLLFRQFGAFDKFWFWTIAYAWEYVSERSFTQSLPELKHILKLIIYSAALLWALSAAGFFAFLLKREFRKHAFFVSGFSLFSVISVCPGFYFRPHYFITLLPVVSLFAAFALKGLRDFCPDRPFITVCFGALVLFGTCYQQRSYFFLFTPEQVSRYLYGVNPFPEAIAVAKYIKENSDEDDKIFILGSEPEIYFYSQRRSATGHIYMFSLVEQNSHAQHMRQEMTNEVENNTPKYVVYSHGTGWIPTESLDPTLQLDDSILQWGQSYIQKHYQQVGLVDLSCNPARFTWGPQSSQSGPASGSFIMIFKRRFEFNYPISPATAIP